ncbi:hypothetical protein P7C70_g7814, partial [Phenoliferia sp. Uapishka_3]
MSIISRNFLGGVGRHLLRRGATSLPGASSVGNARFETTSSSSSSEASTPPGSSKTPVVAAVALVAVGGLAYTQITGEKKLVAPTGAELEALQRARIAHWKVWKAKRDEISQRHDTETKKQLEELERLHPGATERRQACEEKRREIKLKEMKLVKDRHAMTEPGMKSGHIMSWYDKEKIRKEREVEGDRKMRELEERLDREEQERGKEGHTV